MAGFWSSDSCDRGSVASVQEEAAVCTVTVIVHSYTSGHSLNEQDISTQTGQYSDELTANGI